ncbi:MAG: hypothetical protein PHG91_02920 [Syntrophales bacterium]|nr:hypothetical protein [Syntrophales bacterium]
MFVILKRILTGPILTALLLACFLPQNSGAADHTNLEEGIPLQVVDAYATPYLNREIQASWRYERTRESEEKLVLEPRLEYGFARNWQGSISVPVIAGNADQTGSGNVGIETLYNFNAETLFLPALALSGRADLPTGRESAGVDTTLTFIATKMIIPSSRFNRTHFNLSWMHNRGANDDERVDRYRALVGFDIRVGRDTVLVTDLFRELTIKKGERSTMFELGFRTQLTPFTLIGFGASAGLGDQSPRFRITLGFQHSF